MRVGTSLHTACCRCRSWDHPHACGDKTSTANARKYTSGSSPCVWGQVSRYVDNRHFVRIIPMRVGTRSIRCVDCAFTQDHPHACGDKHYSFTTVTARLGSSPCVWGQVSPNRRQKLPDRIIPMRVGTSYRVLAAATV